MAKFLDGSYGTNGQAGAGEGGPEHAEATPAAKAAGNMGVSVTPHVGISPEGEEWKFLSCGIDTLDLSFYVHWDAGWLRLMQSLSQGREKAQAEKIPVVWQNTSLGACVIYPSGKPPMYRYHLQVKELHIFIGIGQCSDSYPNVFVSLNAKALWANGASVMIEKARSLIEGWGGQIGQVKVSRCDLCADFQMSQAIHYQFLLNHGVPENILAAPILKNGTLETYYIGSKNATIRARIYDKAKEVIEHRKMWFLDVWKLEACKDVWRVEFQMRREAIKAYGVDTPQQLFDFLGGIWSDLTGNWFSIRLHDRKNTTRRSIHPWWKAVQDCAEKFGPLVDVQRDLTRHGNADAEYYLTRGANCLLGYAASVGLPDFEEAICEFSRAVDRFWQDRNGFEEAYAAKAVKIDGADPEKGDFYEPSIN